MAYAGQEENEEITEKIERLHAKGVDTVCCPDEKGQIDLKKLMTYLGNEGIDSILLEGGGTLNDSALRAGIVKRYTVLSHQNYLAERTVRHRCKESASDFHQKH